MYLFSSASLILCVKIGHHQWISKCEIHTVCRRGDCYGCGQHCSFIFICVTSIKSDIVCIYIFTNNFGIPFDRSLIMFVDQELVQVEINSFFEYKLRVC